ncbi:MAG TPA: HepT-like ribonuclease domain-containing protein [Alloacidobacterium sp.]|nr:HepT-like ribonuclease domain-containing protein [Alloacidobacterium sp.]
MPSKNPAQRLRDIADNISAIQAFTAHLELDTFLADRKTIYAVVRALEIISGASRRLPDEVTARHPEIDWPAIAAVGNLYRHEYEVVDEKLVWNTVQRDLGVLKKVIESELARLQI